MITVTKKFSKQLIKAMIITIICFVVAIIVCNICQVDYSKRADYWIFWGLWWRVWLLAFIKTRENKEEKAS